MTFETKDKASGLELPLGQYIDLHIRLRPGFAFTVPCDLGRERRVT